MIGGDVSSLAGSGQKGLKDGRADEASFSFPANVATDPAGNVLVADQLNNCLRLINARGEVSTHAGTGAKGAADGTSSRATFSWPRGVAVAEDGTIYVADSDNHVIREISTRGKVSTLAGSSEGFKDGSPSQARFCYPRGLALAKDGSIIVADSLNHCIRKVSPQGVTTLAGSGQRGSRDGPALEASFNQPLAVAPGPNGQVLVTDDSRLCSISPQGWVSTVATGFKNPRGLLVDCRGNVIVADTGHNRIIFCTSQGVVNVIAGDGRRAFKDGSGGEASLNYPCGLTLVPGGRVIVADHGNHRVRALSLPSTLRLQQELLSASSLAGFVIARSVRSLFLWEAVLELQEAGPFGKGPFRFSLEMPFDYPLGAPLVKLLPPFATTGLSQVDATTGEVKCVEWTEAKCGIAEALQAVRALLVQTTSVPVQIQHTNVNEEGGHQEAVESSKNVTAAPASRERSLPVPLDGTPPSIEVKNLDQIGLPQSHGVCVTPRHAEPPETVIPATLRDGSMEFWNQKLVGVLDSDDIVEAASKLSAAGFKQRHVGELSHEILGKAGLNHGAVIDLMSKKQSLLGGTSGEAPVPRATFAPQLPRIAEEELMLEEVVGEGAFSVVYRATWGRTFSVGRQHVHCTKVAVKMSNRSTHKGDSFGSGVSADMDRDLAVIAALPHQNILTLHGVCESSSGPPKIVFELMSTDLSKVIKESLNKSLKAKQEDSQSHRQLLSTHVLLRVLRDVSAGLAHLHAHGVVHRDVKPANVLLRDDLVKLCDFGSSKDLQHTVQKMTVAGTLNYMAPEVLNSMPAGRAADVWSFGVMLFECVTGAVCSRATSMSDLTDELVRAGCLPALVQLFAECHQADQPSKRPPMAEIHARLQCLVMKDASDSQRLKEELKRAEAQDHDTYETTWESCYASQPHMQELLGCANAWHNQQSPQRVRQPLQQLGGKGSMEELEGLASGRVCAHMHALLKALVEGCGGTYVCAPRKSYERCMQKVEQEYGGDYSKLLDLERATGLFDQAEDMLKCVQKLQQGISQSSEVVVVHTGAPSSPPSSSSEMGLRVLRCKDRLSQGLGDSGYRDLLLNVCDAQSGFVAELQLNFHKIAQIKSQTHRFYELVRVMELQQQGLRRPQ